MLVQPHKDSKGPVRAAYHGHLTQLAAKLQASKHGLLQATLDMNRDWQSFKTSYLDPQLHLEDRNSWQVDLPSEHPGPDDLTDPSACQMDVYSQADFDNTEVSCCAPPSHPAGPCPCYTTPWFLVADCRVLQPRTSVKCSSSAHVCCFFAYVMGLLRISTSSAAECLLHSPT